MKPRLALRLKVDATDFSVDDFEDYIAGQRAVAGQTDFISATWDIDKDKIYVYYGYHISKGPIHKGQKLVWVS